MTKHQIKRARAALLCRCGCRQTVPQLPGSGRPRVWIDEHKPGRTKERKCECGCNRWVVREHNRGALPRFYPGHAPSEVS